MSTFLMVVQFVISIGLILVVLLQESTAEGMGSIGGSAQMFHDKRRGADGALQKMTTYLAVAFMVLSIALTAIV